MIVPGEFIVELTASSQLASAELPRGAARGKARRRTLGWTASFDALLRKIDCLEIRRVHRKLPIRSGKHRDLYRRMDATFLIRVDPGRRSPQETMAFLREHRAVSEVESNRLFLAASQTDFSHLTVNDAALAQIRAKAAQALTKGDPGVRVAILDSGVDATHPLLHAASAGGIDTVDLTGQAPPGGFHWAGDAAGRDDDPSDDSGHGTHVAGIICAQHPSGGVAPDCKFHAIRVLAKLERANGPSEMAAAGKTDDIARGVQEAVARGALVLNMSFANAAVDFVAGSGIERKEMTLAIRSGAILVAAMGNEGLAGSDAFPATLANSAAVVAVGAIDANDQRLAKSQVGSHNSVVAPGQNIVSTLPGGAIGVLTGTSMATAYVSAAAALAQSYRKKLGKGLLAPGDLKVALMESARNLPGAFSPRSDELGEGCLDIKALLDRVQQLP